MSPTQREPALKIRSGSGARAAAGEAASRRRPPLRLDIAPAGRGTDTAADVARAVPARRPTLGAGAPAAAVAGVGARWARAPREARRRTGRARLGRRLRSVGLASDPQRVGRPFGPG